MNIFWFLYSTIFELWIKQDIPGIKRDQKGTSSHPLCFLLVFLLQLARYKELKELAQKQGAVFSQQAEKLHWEVKADYEKMAFDQRRKKEVEVLSVTHY